MKKHIVAIMGLILCFIINIGVVNAQGAKAIVEYTKDNQTKTLTMEYPDGKEHGIIMIGNSRYSTISSGKGIFNACDTSASASGGSFDVQKDEITGNMSEHIGKDITIKTYGAIKDLEIVIDSYGDNITYNVTLQTDNSTNIRYMILQMTNDNYKLTAIGGGTLGSIMQSGGTFTINGANIIPERNISGGNTGSLDIKGKFNMLSGTIDLTNPNANGIIISSSSTFVLGDSSKPVSDENPEINLGSKSIDGQLSFNNGVIYSNSQIPDSKFTSTASIKSRYLDSSNRYKYYIEDKWDKFVELFMGAIDNQYKDPDYEVSNLHDESSLTVRMVYDGERHEYVFNYNDVTGVMTYSNPSGDEDSMVENLSALAVKVLLTMNGKNADEIEETLEWIEDNIDDLTLADNGIYLSFNSQNYLTKFDLDIKNGITMTEGTDEDPTVDKIWSDFTKAYITKITKTLGDNLVGAVVSENTLKVTYKIDKEDGNDINSSIVFTYKDGVVSYKAPSNFAKEYLDDLDPSLIPAIELDSDAKNLLILLAIETLGDMKGYDSKTLLAWLEDAANNYKLSKDGIEVSTFDYEYELEDSVIDVSGKFEVIKSFDLDIKNGLKITKDAEKDDKKSDKDGEIPPAYTGVGVSIITIGALSGGYITIKKKRNILNRL